MTPSNDLDRLSNLPEGILIMIISLLPFKECIRTSVLSRRWRTLCHETKNISFKEAEYMEHYENDFVPLRNSFMHYMFVWVLRFQGAVINTFELCLSTPVDFLEHVEFLIEFAVSRRVKNLVLDFSEAYWTSIGDAECIVELPICVYGLLTTLESLKIFACNFDTSRFAAKGLPRARSFTVGWIPLPNLERLISNSPKLESLIVYYCWDVYVHRIAGNMKEVVLDNCIFPYLKCTFELPNVDIFKYSGQVLPFDFKRMNVVIKEVYLDFGFENEYDEPTNSTQLDGETVSGFLNVFRGARTLTVCPYLLQTIQECQNPDFALHPMETQHLVLRTKMQAKEHKGITHLLHNCPHLETLTLDLLFPRLFKTDVMYGDVDPMSYWLSGTSYEHFPKRLEAVVVKNYYACFNEYNVMRYLIKCRLRPGFALKKVDVYMIRSTVGIRRIFQDLTIKKLQSFTEDVRVIVHDA